MTPAHQLRGKVWLSYILHSQNLALAQFSDRYLEGRKGGHASLVHKWNSGQAVPSRQTVIRISKSCPSAHELYFLPLWELLIDKPVSRSAVCRITSSYWVEGKEGFIDHWSFPESEFVREGCPLVVFKTDGDGLMQRGDLYGFMAIAALVREAEAIGDGDSHWGLAACLYRAIPAVARLPWMRPHLDLLKICVQQIHTRLNTSSYLFDVDWQVLERQIDDEAFEPLREKRARDALTQRFIDLDDPIILRF